MKASINDIEERLRAIEHRNIRVEADKAWELSVARRITIAILTYIVTVIYLFVIGDKRSFIDAIAPPVGFLLSTLVMRDVKNFWQKQNKNKT